MTIAVGFLEAGFFSLVAGALLDGEVHRALELPRLGVPVRKTAAGAGRSCHVRLPGQARDVAADGLADAHSLLLGTLVLLGQLERRAEVATPLVVGEVSHEAHGKAWVWQCVNVSAEEIDAYLSSVGDEKRQTLEELRRVILEILPEAVECISYRIPAFRVDGKVVAGFAAFAEHLSYLPFSGSTLGRLSDQLDGYTRTKSALHFTPEHPLQESLVRALIDTRLQEIETRGR